MRSKVALVLVAALCLMPLAGCRRDPRPGPTAGSAPSGTTTWTLAFGGEQRSYRLYVPAGLPDPSPVVFMLHGGFGNAEHAQTHYNWMPAADSHRLAVVFPDGLGRAWNVGGGCCGAPGRQGVDDVGFIAAVLSDVDKHLTVDHDRVYATGMSNGAMLAHRLACDTDLFAAIAPVAGTLLGDCPNPHPVSVLHIHGLADTNVPFDGSRGTGFAQIDGPPVPAVLQMWRTVDGCPEPAATTGPAGVTTLAAHCPQGRDVVLITIADAGHQWPGSSTGLLQDAAGADSPSTALDATEVIAEFFAAHPRAA